MSRIATQWRWRLWLRQKSGQRHLPLAYLPQLSLRRTVRSHTLKNQPISAASNWNCWSNCWQYWTAATARIIYIGNALRFCLCVLFFSRDIYRVQPTFRTCNLQRALWLCAVMLINMNCLFMVFWLVLSTAVYQEYLKSSFVLLGTFKCSHLAVSQSMLAWSKWLTLDWEVAVG